MARHRPSTIDDAEPTPGLHLRLRAGVLSLSDRTVNGRWDEQGAAMGNSQMGHSNEQHIHGHRPKAVSASRTRLIPTDAEAKQERRRSFRVQVPAEAMLWRKGQFAGRYQLDDLSIGGCRLSDGPARAAGDQVEVLIRMPHHGALSLPARIVRRTMGSRAKPLLGLRFDGPSATAEDWIHDVVLWALEESAPGGPRLALVVSDRSKPAGDLVHQLRKMGRDAIAAHTPLDAIQLLVEQGERVDVVLIDERVGAGRGLEIAQFLAANHPGVRRVMLGGTENTHALASALSCGTAEGVLTLPTVPRELDRILRDLGCWQPMTRSGASAKC
jgi:CheY-like chemotaxis protein